MIIIACVLTALFLVEVFTANQAPFGYQDETGFHFGQPHHAARTPQIEWR